MFFGFALATVAFIILDAGITKRTIMQVINHEKSSSGSTLNNSAGQSNRDVLHH